ncbi:MAG: BA14K family protein [Cohaesibacteraceae bacterium]|nr:BA14K family protein [Cohaesibacteraceae bacterium]
MQNRILGSLVCAGVFFAVGQASALPVFSEAPVIGVEAQVLQIQSYSYGGSYSPPKVYKKKYRAPAYRAPVRYKYVRWSDEWYAYCEHKYRSFNPRTGKYLAYSGKWRWCK